MEGRGKPAGYSLTGKCRGPNNNKQLQISINPCQFAVGSGEQTKVDGLRAFIDIYRTGQGGRPGHEPR